MSNFNKVVTNIPVSLTETEMYNLSQTFSGIIQGGGGGGEGKRYIGDGVYVTVNNDANPGVISLTQTSLDKLNKEIPSAVSSFPDSIQYAKKTYVDNTFQTKSDMSEYLTTNDASTTYQTKEDMSAYYDKTETSSKAQLTLELNKIAQQVNMKEPKIFYGYDENDAISSINSHKLAGAGGVTGDYYSASNPSGFINSAQAETQILAKNYITSGVSQLDNFYSKTDTSSKTELQTKFDSLLDYNVTAAAGIEVTTATDVGIKTFGISMTAQPVVTDTRLSGYNGIAAEPDGNVTGLWDVGLTQDMLNTINGKLDTTAAAQTYQPKGDYVSSTDITDMATMTWVGSQGYLTQVPSEYVTDIELQTTLGDYATKTLVQNTSAAITALIPSTAGLASENDLQIVSAGVDYVSAHTITAHQPLTDYYTKSQTSGATEISNALGNKVDKPVSLNNKYLVLRTNGDGSVSGWVDFNDNVYSKTEADGRYQKKEDMGSYLTTAQYETDSATFYTTSNPAGYLNKTVADTYYQPTGYYATSAGLTTGNQYAMTTNGWEVVQGGTSFTGVVTGTGLSGNGLSTSPLGIDTTAAIYLTNGSAKSAVSAESATNALSSRYAKQLQDASKIIEIKDVTALQNWASSNSSTWNDVTAKLGTAQYANDSATFVTSSNDSISAGGEQYALTTTGWAKIQAGSTLTAGSGVEIVSNVINALLGTDLAFNSTTSAIQINTNGTAAGNFAFVEGDSTYATSTAHAEGYHTTALNNAHAEGNSTYASGYGAHAEGFHTSAYGLGVRAAGAYTVFSANGDYDGRGVAVEGYANATTAQTTAHNGILKVIGNGTGAGAAEVTGSDAYILYRDGTVSAKQFQNADGTETINGTTYNFSGVDNIEILPNAATANTANFPNDNVLRFILES